MRIKQRFLDLCLAVLADTLADLGGIMEEILFEPDTPLGTRPNAKLRVDPGSRLWGRSGATCGCGRPGDEPIGGVAVPVSAWGADSQSLDDSSGQ
jgi:hypothetical protein